MKNVSETSEWRLSVRELVEWVLRSGDIDNRRGGPATEDAMLIGAEAHRKIQKASGAGYRAEVPLKITVPIYEAKGFGEDGTEISGEIEPDLEKPNDAESNEFGNDEATIPLVYLTVDGRADGIIDDGIPEGEELVAMVTGDHGEDCPVIDEIKGVFRNVFAMEKPEPVHLAQAEVYAYIYALQEDLPEIDVQMTYVGLEETKDRKKVVVRDDCIRRFRFHYTFAEITERFAGYINGYRPWILFSEQHKKARNESIDGFGFPYEYRPGQKKIVGSVYKTIENGGNLFVEAPTGIGKTLSMLYPSVQAVGRGLADRIFYLTAKTVTARVAEEGLSVMNAKGLCFSYTKIGAKEKLCPFSETICDPIHCDRAKGHFSRVNEALYALITAESEISSEIVSEYAEKYQVCPYELSLDASLFTDVVICDYNYVFSPHVYLRRYFDGDNGQEYIMLADEAHNLPERAREIFSATVVKEELLAAKKLFPGEQTILKHLEKANKILLELKRECEGTTVFSEDTFPTVLYHTLSLLQEALSRYFDRVQNPEEGAKKTEFYFKVRDFVTTYENLDEGFMTYASFTDEGEFFLKLFCIQPSGRLSERLERMRASVFFSATFLPIQYYKELLTGGTEDPAIYVDSPFDPASRRILLQTDVSTKYTRRNAEEYRKIAKSIVTVVAAKPGNYLAFFPSHKFLEDVKEALERMNPPLEVIAQKRNMTEEERAAFLGKFTGEAGDSGSAGDFETGTEELENVGAKSLLGLSVMGGLFSEGIDLRGDALIGVFVVGTGLPQVSPERELIKNYYDMLEKNGFDFAYRFPGFNKVMQAAGRLIRTTEDEGVILLMDERFRYRENRILFPKEWADAEPVTGETAVTKIREFWESRTKI